MYLTRKLSALFGPCVEMVVRHQTIVGSAESMNLPSFRSKRVRVSSSWALFLCLLTLTLCVPATTTTTIQSPDGDIIECTDILAQPSFSHPLLKDHTLQEVPRDLPNTAKNEDEVSRWQIWNGNGLKCPEGTIPIRTVDSPKNGATNSKAGAGLAKGHKYAVARYDSNSNIYGTKFTMSVGHPKVADHDGEFSLGQTWVTSGSLKGGDMNTIEAGWQVFPGLYFDNQPRLFIFWTNDAYSGGSCYNLRCPGFIQTSGNVLVEGAIDPHTEAITIQIWKDPNHGHWWFSVGPNNGTILMPVGYWPNEIFTCLTDHAQIVDWGGEIVDENVSGLHTTTQMGSGYLPSSARAAYMRDLEIMVDAQHFQPIDDFTVLETEPSYYKFMKTSTTSFTYGGPEHAGTVHLRVNLFFCLFMFQHLLNVWFVTC